METTLNMHIDVLEKITRAAQKRGISRSKLIVQLIKNVMHDIPDPGRMGRLVKYQERSRPENWHTFHIHLRIDDYEYLLDLRKLLKMSVSSILVYAVETYLGKLMNTKGTDNNRYKNYIIMRELIDDIICWKFIWGFPPNLEKHLPGRSYCPN